MSDDWLGCYLFPDSEPQKKKRARKTDDVWDAMMVVFWEPGFKPVNEQEHKRLSRLVEMARERLPKGVHKTAAISILRERVRLYKKHKSFIGLSASADAVMNRWYDVAQDPDVTLRELCKEWLGTIPQHAQVLSSSFDDTDRLVAWLLFQEEAGELREKRPELADAAAFMLERFRRKYSYSTGRPIRRAIEELRELA